MLSSAPQPVHLTVRVCRRSKNKLTNKQTNLFLKTVVSCFHHCTQSQQTHVSPLALSLSRSGVLVPVQQVLLWLPPTLHRVPHSAAGYGGMCAHTPLKKAQRRCAELHETHERSAASREELSRQNSPTHYVRNVAQSEIIKIA